MINLRRVMETLADEIQTITARPNLQIIDRKYLDNLPEDVLQVPRVIIDLMDVRDSRFYYEVSEHDAIADTMSIGATRISYIDVSMNFISDFSDTVAEELAELVRDYYNNPFTIKLNPFGAIVTDPVSVRDINQWGMKSDVNIIRLRMRFRLSNESIYETDEWAERAEGLMKVGDGIDLEFKN